jgi:fatty-acyl-CoA synthase
MQNMTPEEVPDFLRRFASDPSCVRTEADIEQIERIPIGERIACSSTTEALRRAAERSPDRPALTFLPNGSADDTPQRWTYRAYWDEVTAAANLFHELGLTPGTSVALLLPNVPEMLFAIWGAQAAGIAAPINPFLEPDQIAAIARNADAVLLVTLSRDRSPGLWAKAQAVRERLPTIRHVIEVGGSGDGALDWARETQRQPRGRLAFERTLDGSEPSAYFHTGGTTGVPRLACHLHGADVANVGQMLLTTLVDGQDLSPDNVILCGLPLFHASAYVAAALSSILRHAELLLAGPAGFREPRLVRDFWRIVEKYKVTFFNVVPTVYAALLDQSSREYDISSLRLAGSGGAPLSVALLKEFRDRTGADVVEGYGMTECTACATAHTLRGARKPGSVGLRLPYQRIRIVELDATGAIVRECGVDEIGVILLAGPNVIPTYKPAAANEGRWPEAGWLNTGDLGRRDADGYYWITGRAKDLIIRGGHNIDPAITEEALMLHPDVVEAAAVGMPDPYAGELPMAYVRVRPGSRVDAAELREHARQKAMERAAAPVEVVLCDELPKTAVGKIFKPALRRDAIRRAYARAIDREFGAGFATIEVRDDPATGVKVLIRLPEGLGGDVRERLASLLSGYTQAWAVETDGRRGA